MNDQELFWNIEEELGEVTDFELTFLGTHTRVEYKSNGEQKSIYLNDINCKMLLQSFLFCARKFADFTPANAAT